MTFGEQLTYYMQRIDVSANQLANKIDVSPQAVISWMRDEYKPRKTKRASMLKMANYLRLQENEVNNLLISVGFEQEYLLEQNLADEIFSQYIQDLLLRLNYLHYPVILLLAQANWGEPPLREAILRQARRRYTTQQILHIQPPYSISEDINQFFADLGQQCCFPSLVYDHDFRIALEQHLKTQQPLFLLISRFEQSPPVLHSALAALLRGLIEKYPKQLHVLVCGGEKLAALKNWQTDSLSLFNIAQVEMWPEMSLADVYAHAKYLCQNFELDDEQTEQLLHLSGGHPLLLNACLQRQSTQTELVLSPDDYVTYLSQNEQIRQTFIPFIKTAEIQQKLLSLLQKKELGQSAVNYPIKDELICQLFWKNLLISRKNANGNYSLQWRCEAIRRAGEAVCQSENE